MMDAKQHLLSKIAEECNEIAQRCQKAMIFGLNDHHPKKEMNNEQEICKELDHLWANIELLAEIGFDYTMSRARIEAKKHVILAFMEYSVERGCTSPEALKNFEGRRSYGHDG